MRIDIPIPTEPIFTVTKDGAVIWSRSWYRFLTGLGEAVGYDTDGVFFEILANVPSPEAAVGQVMLNLAARFLDADSRISSMQGMIEGLQQRIATLEMQAHAPV